MQQTVYCTEKNYNEWIWTFTCFEMLFYYGGSADYNQNSPSIGQWEWNWSGHENISHSREVFVRLVTTVTSKVTRICGFFIFNSLTDYIQENNFIYFNNITSCICSLFLFFTRIWRSSTAHDYLKKAACFLRIIYNSYKNLQRLRHMRLILEA